MKINRHEKKKPIKFQFVSSSRNNEIVNIIRLTSLAIIAIIQNCF